MPLSLFAVQVIGYDMDYTLVRYRVDQWEQRAYHYAKVGPSSPPHHAAPCAPFGGSRPPFLALGGPNN